MDNDYDMEHNAVLLKRCNKIYNTITIIYASICIPYAVSQIFIGFLFQLNPIPIIFDSLFCKSSLLSCGFLACYKHNNKFILFALLIQTINILINDGNLNMCLIFIVIILSGVTVYANKKYQYLKKQFGFPYFNEYVQEKNFEYHKSKLKNEFQQNYEHYMKNSFSDMTDINSTAQIVDLTKKENTDRKNIINNMSSENNTIFSDNSDKMTDIDLNYKSNDLG